MALISFGRRNAPRRDLRRIDLAGRGLGVTLVIVLLLGLAYLRTTGGLGGDPEVSAQVRNAGGALRPGSDVKIAGVIVGRVNEISRGTDDMVRVDLAIRSEDLDSVPDNVVARILPATVFGTTFVDLVVYDGPSGTPLKANATIPADVNQDTLELQQALDDIDRLVTALGPAELASAISSAAQALEGRGEEIGRIIDVADSYLARLTPQLPLVRSDLGKLAENLELVDDLAPDFLDATEDGLVTLDTIVEQRASITALITGGTTLTRTGQRFLDENTRRLVRMLENGAILLDILFDNRKVGITGSIAANIEVGKKFPTAIREGFIQAEGPLELDAPDYYTKADRPDYGRMQDASLRSLAGGER
jgi:virulence factor Mce-like protein